MFSGLVLGRDGGLIATQYIPFYLGLGGPMGSGKQYFSWIHVRDCAGIITHAIENPKVSGILNAVSPDLATNQQFTDSFAKALWRWAILPMPVWVLSLIFGAKRASVMTTGCQILPQRTLESGYQFVYPKLDKALHQIVHQLPFE